MKRYIKHIIGPIFFVLIIGAVALYVTSVHFGALTLDVLELVAGVDIGYEHISGNVLQGFRINNYHVKLSETDSIYGAVADIHYRFNPFMLRLPNVFEINLIEPRITIQKKEAVQSGGFRGLPNLRLGLRINLKNGEVLYKNKEQYELERISGIVYLDLVGRKTRLTAMNLSLQSVAHSLYVTSLTLDAEIDEEQIELRSFKLSGTGIQLEGNGQYNYIAEYATFNINRGYVDLKKMKRHEGLVDFTGSISYLGGNFLPKVRGRVTGFKPFDEFGFETAAAEDTIWVNLFDGQILGGSLFAQLKIIQLREVEFAMNFKDIDVSGFLGMDKPAISSGYVSYFDDRFTGMINSPHDLGLGLDSVFFFGTYSESTVRLDSLFVSEGRRALYARGTIIPKVDLEMDFRDFDLSRFHREFPVGGRLNGSVRITGELLDPLGLSLTSSLLASNLTVYGFGVDSLTLSSDNFQKDSRKRNLAVTLHGLNFRDYHFQQSDFQVQDSLFRFLAFDEKDSIYLDGALGADLRGEIRTFLVNYNQVLTKSVGPIDFDIIRRTMGTINLSLADGSFLFSNFPLSMELKDVDLARLGKLFGLRDTISGTVDLDFTEDRLHIRARQIHFIGLENGILDLTGQYANRMLIIDSLHIHDDNNQILDLKGSLSVDHSELVAKFSDVGIWVLTFLKNFMSDPKGLMTGEVAFRGNLRRFEFSGGGKIHDGSFSLGIIASKFDSVNTDVVFEGDRILFVSGKATISPSNGRKLNSEWMSGGGVVKMEEKFRVDNLNFDFSFADAPLQFPPFAYGTGTGNFSISMRDRIVYYNGNITVKEAVVPIEFGMKIEEEQLAKDDNWRVNLRLKAERNVWLRNPDADIEFGGELSITRETGPVNLSGVLESDRGNYYWVNHILNITQGKVTFIPGGEIDPDVDFWAKMATREGVTIVLHMFGPISQPIFEFYTDPPGQYTEQDIVTYLNLNITWQELEQLKRGEYMSKIIPHSLLSWLEGDVSRAIRQYTGLDYFHIETPFFEADEKTKLTVGKFLARNLFVTYTYDITTFSNEFNVEYFIDDKNKIQVERDETGEYGLQYQYRLRF
jgi:hypothetical protein